MTKPSPTNGTSPPFTILIPAHNEASVIGRTLRTMRDGSPVEGAPEIIVICNGCSDDTAAVARLTAPDVRVIELSVGSKTLAINTGLDAAHRAPVIIVDGDIEITHRDLSALATTLRKPGIMAASPAATMELEGCDFWARAYYRVWAAHGYLSSGVGGSGVYGLSEAALQQIGRFPLIIADDTFVRWEFPLSQQERVVQDALGRPVRARVHAPTRVGNIISCEARWHSGNIELRRAGKYPKGGKWSKSQASLTSNRQVPLSDLGVFYGIKILGRAMYLYNIIGGRAGIWHRDKSRR